MPLSIVQVQGGQLALADADGNVLAIITDGGAKKLATAARLHDGSAFYKATTPSDTQPISAASLPLPAGAATETTLALIKAKTDAIPTDPAKESGKLTSLETILTAIRDTAGIKKITDALPAGTSEIGRVAQGTKAAPADAWPTVLYDASGNAITYQKVEGRGAPGVAPVGNPIYSAGWDGTYLRALLTDSQGRIITAPPGSKAILRGFSNGRTVRSAVAIVPVEETPYTEQTANAQRSIASASAADASAGTGARTVQITYYSVSGGVITGPFTETVTLNGTTYVNTVSTTIAFIEKIEALTVGSGLTNAGILTLKAGTAGGGATIVTIPAGAGQTYMAHHYVASGRTMYLTGVSIGIKGADGAAYTVAVDDPSNVNAYERVVSDILRMGTGQTTNTRSYGTPIEIAGPAHVRVYVQPDSTSSRTYYAAFDFYEE